MPTDLTTKQVLIGARALVAAGWTQEVYATDEHGTNVDPLSSSACRFCCLGAIARVMEIADVGNGQLADDVPATVSLEKAAGRNIPSFNDALGRTKEQVLAVFDQAIDGEEE